MRSVAGANIGAINTKSFLAACVFWIWMLISAIQNNGLNGTEKVVWVLVFFLHFLGAFLYFLLGYSRRLNQGTQ